MSTSRSTVPSLKRASQTYFRRRPKDGQRRTDVARIATGRSTSLTRASSQGAAPPLPNRGSSCRCVTLMSGEQQRRGDRCRLFAEGRNEVAERVQAVCQQGTDRDRRHRHHEDEPQSL